MGKFRSGWKRKPYGQIRQMQWIEKSSSESGSSACYNDHIIYTTLKNINFPDIEHDITDVSDDPYLDIKLEASCSAKIGSVLKEIKQSRGCQIFDAKKPARPHCKWDADSSTEPSDCESTSGSVSSPTREPLFPGLPPLPGPTPKAPPPTPTDGQMLSAGDCPENKVYKKTSAVCSTGDFGIRYPSSSLFCTFGKQPVPHWKQSNSLKLIKEEKGGNVAATAKKNCFVFKAPQQSESRLQVTADKLAAEKEASISHLLDKLKSRHNLTQELGRGSSRAKTTKPNVLAGRRLAEENYARLDSLARAELHLKAKGTVQHSQNLEVRTAPSRSRLPVKHSGTSVRLERTYSYGRFRRMKD